MNFAYLEHFKFREFWKFSTFVCLLNRSETRGQNFADVPRSKELGFQTFRLFSWNSNRNVNMNVNQKQNSENKIIGALPFLKQLRYSHSNSFCIHVNLVQVELCDCTCHNMKITLRRLPLQKVLMWRDARKWMVHKKITYIHSVVKVSMYGVEF